MTSRPLLHAMAAALLLASGPVAADSPLDRAEPEARKRFEAAASSYKALGYYGDRGTFSRTIRLGGRERSETSPLSLEFARPNRIVLDAGEVKIVGDGKTLTTVLGPTKRFLSAPSPDALNVTRISDGPAGAILFGGASGPPSQLLLKLVLGVEPADALPDRASGLKLDKDREWEGVSYPCLLVEQGDEPPLRVLIDPKTNLIRRMEYVLDPKGLASRVPTEGELAEMGLAWTSGPIATEAPARSPFAFQAPAGYERIEAAKPKVAAAEARNPLVGKPAPDFTLTVLDGAGKTKKVTRADLAGKVVLLDFWATWCPPCLAELPEIQKLAEELALAKKAEVAIVAVSQDREPEDGPTARKLVEGLLESKKLDLAKGPIARVALDPEQAVGDAFGVQALPTVVLLDAKGVVQAVHVGYSEDVKDVLMDEIVRLLEGKTLVDPKAAEADEKGQAARK